MGLSFITEGAIPFGAADPARAIPSFILGSAVVGGPRWSYWYQTHGATRRNLRYRPYFKMLSLPSLCPGLEQLKWCSL